MARDNDVTFEVVQSLGTISEGSRGWKKELNRVSWNGAAPKYDIRDWNDEHSRMSKGITLTEEELRALGNLINAEVSALDKGKNNV